MNIDELFDRALDLWAANPVMVRALVRRRVAMRDRIWPASEEATRKVLEAIIAAAPAQLGLPFAA